MSEFEHELECVIEHDYLGRRERLQFSSRAAGLGLFGPSGAGKTLIIETLAGLRPDIEDYLRVGARVLCDRRARHCTPSNGRGMAWVPQAALLFPHCNVRDNLLFGARERGRARVDLDRVVRLLEIESLLPRSTARLSGGEQQRVALGRALLSAPDLLLLDEPFSGMDAPLRSRLVDRVAALCAELSIGIVLVSHDAAEIRALCAEVLVLDRGRICAQGPSESLLASNAALTVPELDVQSP